jgi:hypothetical protein
MNMNLMAAGNMPTHEEYIDRLKRHRQAFTNFANALDGIVTGMVCCILPLTVPLQEDDEALAAVRLLIANFAASVQQILVFEIDEALKRAESSERELPKLLEQSLVNLCAQRDTLQAKLESFDAAEEKMFAKYPEGSDMLGPVWGLMKESLTDQLAQTDAAISGIQKQMEK